MITTTGRAHEYPGGVMIATTRPDVPNLGDEVEVILRDARRISPEQRRKAYALMGESARKCAVCGRRAELHHVDRVGMGRDRREICHIGMQALPCAGSTIRRPTSAGTRHC